MRTRKKKKRRFLKQFNGLNFKDKLLVAGACLMTLVALMAIPVIAWFAHQKQVVTMAKIDSPAKLSLKSGAGEDIVNFKMSGIDVTEGSRKDFVFCVEGEDISRYNIQLAHTTNINFTYTLYQATEASTGVVYIKEDGNPVYYQKAGTALAGDYVNARFDDSSSRNIGTDRYDEPSYDKGNEKRQKFAEPLYWQNSTPIVANNAVYDEDEDENAFQNFYILEVSWDASVVNDKETDMIYITAQVK